jgi:hypothetical protein
MQMGSSSPVMHPEFHDWNLALLAFSVRAQHRREEAKDIAAPLCSSLSQRDQRTRQTLEAARVCDPD